MNTYQIIVICLLTLICFFLFGRQIFALLLGLFLMLCGIFWAVFHPIEATKSIKKGIYRAKRNSPIADMLEDAFEEGMKQQCRK